MSEVKRTPVLIGIDTMPGTGERVVSLVVKYKRRKAVTVYMSSHRADLYGMMLQAAAANLDKDVQRALPEPEIVDPDTKGDIATYDEACALEQQCLRVAGDTITCTVSEVLALCRRIKAEYEHSLRD